MDYKQLIEIAFEVRENGYAPYSGFKSGVALLAKNGEVFTGCTVEIASFTPSVSAVQSAFANALSNGIRQFSAIAIVGGVDEMIFDYCPPDGVARQVIQEFCSQIDFDVILAKSSNEFIVYSFDDLFPVPFTKNTVIK